MKSGAKINQRQICASGEREKERKRERGMVEIEQTER